VDLTGTWQAGERFIFYVYQDADCIWIVGNFVAASDAEGFGNLWEATFLFHGQIEPDLTVHGEWAVLRYRTGPEVGGPFASGRSSWNLELDAEPWILRGEGPPTLAKISDAFVEP
jgi:hypothetical protein